MSLDGAGQRANDQELNAKARWNAGWNAFWSGLGGFIAGAWDFFLRNLLLWMAIAFLAGLYTWEWWNSGRGWVDLYPGAGVLAFIGAAGAVGLWFFAVGRAREDFRAKKNDGWMWTGVSVAMFIVSVIGVWAAVASNSIASRRDAKESRIEYAKLIGKRDALAAKVEINDPAAIAVQVDGARQTLKAMVETGKVTYSLPDLDIGGGCPDQQKRAIAQSLCAQANGGFNPLTGQTIETGFRTRIAQLDAAHAAALKDAEALQVLQNSVDHFTVKTGDETADAMGDMITPFSGQVTDSQKSAAMGWVYLVLSSLLLGGGGFLGDWVFQTIEDRRQAAKVKAKAGKP